MPADLDNPLYNDPSVYDILHAGGTAEEVDGLERIVARFCSPAAAGLAWLEPACGTGRYIRVAARRGRRVYGFDRSPEMIAYAERRLAADERWRRAAGGSAKLFVADMTNFSDLPAGGGDGGRAGVEEACGFAFCLINTFRHLGSDTGRDDAALAHLDQVRRTLAPGGVYAVGLHITAYGLETPSEDVWTAQRGAKHVTQVVQYEPATREERLEAVVSHLVVRTESGERHEDAVYRLRSYDHREWAALLDRAGWEQVACVDEHGEDHAIGAGSGIEGSYGYGIFILRPR